MQYTLDFGNQSTDKRKDEKHIVNDLNEPATIIDLDNKNIVYKVQT